MARTTIPAELVAINAIQGTLIADNAITAVHIATNAVSGTLVADNAITSTHIAQNNVTATQIAQNTITVTQLADNAVETDKINNDAVTQAKIADDAVGPDQLAANAVVSASIANGTIVAADLADDAVTLAKMAGLARGSIIYGDSAGDPAALSIGSNDYVLTSDGTDIAWEAAAGGVAGITSSADATAIAITSAEHIYLVDATGEVVSGSEFVTLQTTGHGMAIKTAAIPMFCWTTAATTYGAQTLIGFYHASSSVGAITTNNSATQYTTSSDYRLKENVDYTWDATTRLKQLKPARFNWINDDDNTTVDGFLAHEVQSVVPAAVAGNKDAVYTAEEAEDMVEINAGDIKPQSIDESKLVPLLVKTIQELEARITTLEG